LHRVDMMPAFPPAKADGERETDLLETT